MGKITPSSITCIIGSEKNAGEGCHKGGNSLQGPVCQPSVPSITEGWRATTVVKLKELNTFIPYKHFKMEGFIHLRKLWNKATICASWTSNTPIKQTVKEIYTSQMGGFPLRIPLSVFRFGPVPRLFTK